MPRPFKPTLDPIEFRWEEILLTLGYDSNHPHLRDSPKRVAKFMRSWHTEGKKPPCLTVFPNVNPTIDEMVANGGFRFYSLCAHHGLPFFGEAAIGYIPGKKIVGLSKFARVLDHFAHRFTVQENLTHYVAEYMEKRLKPVGLGVVIRAEHMCMSMRGVERPNHTTITSDMRGAFRSAPHAKAELLALLGAAR